MQAVRLRSVVLPRSGWRPTGFKVAYAGLLELCKLVDGFL